jgi:hypothetical protein
MADDCAWIVMTLPVSCQRWLVPDRGGAPPALAAAQATSPSCDI